jgi:hypothetical protein
MDASHLHRAGDLRRLSQQTHQNAGSGHAPFPRVLGSSPRPNVSRLPHIHQNAGSGHAPFPRGLGHSLRQNVLRLPHTHHSAGSGHDHVSYSVYSFNTPYYVSGGVAVIAGLALFVIGLITFDPLLCVLGCIVAAAGSAGFRSCCL